jgi:hypothetical protein
MNRFPRSRFSRCRCRRVVLFTALSIGTTGILIISLLAAIVCFIKYNLTEVGRTIFIVTVLFLVISIALLVFTIYASWKKNHILRGTATIIFIVLGLSTFGLALYCLAGKNVILRGLGSLWDEPIDDYVRYVEALEKSFHCCGWSDPREECQEKFTKLCNETFSHVFSHGFAAVSGSLLVFSVILLTGCVFAVRTLFVPELPSDKDQAMSGSLIVSVKGNSGSRHYNASEW